MIDKNKNSNTNPNLKWLVIATFVSVVILILSFIIINECNVASQEEVLSAQINTKQPAMLQQDRTREDSLLTSYEVLDSAQAIYRIPINRAMELIAAGGDN